MTTFVEVKTAGLIGPALDWAVAEAIEWKEPIFCVGRISYIKEDQYLMMEKPDPDEPDEVTKPHHFNHCDQWSPSRIWSQGGPLISNYRVSIIYSDEDCDPCAWTDDTAAWHGPTPLVAACRAIVAAKLGDAVQVPAELVGSCVASDHDVPSAAQPRCRECDDRICNGTGVYEGRKTGIVGNQVARKFVCQDDQREVDELVALGIEQDKREIERLRAEVEALRKDKARLDTIEQECWDVLVEARHLLALHSGEAMPAYDAMQVVDRIDAALAAKEGRP